MAFVVATKRGNFEIRESHMTPSGPRSRTLATFSELTDEVIERAVARAAKPLRPEDLREAARRAGAPVAQAPANRAARELIAELGRGRTPEPRLRRMLGKMLEGGETGSVAPADPGQGVAEWMAASAAERGRTLYELLLLADAIPHGGRRGQPLVFPRLDSGRT